MPQLNPEFFASQIFWLVIAFLMVYFFVSKFFIPLMEKAVYGREAKISADVEASKNILESYKFDKDSIASIIDNAKTKAMSETADASKKAELFLKEEIGKLDLEISAKIAAESERLSRYKNQLMKDIDSVSEKLSADIIKKLSETNNININ